MNELRTEVWDYLHKNGPGTTSTVAIALQQQIQLIQEAIDHEWFDVQGDIVSIAATKPSNAKDGTAQHGDTTQCSEAESTRRIRRLFHQP